MSPSDLVTVRPEGLYCPAGDFYIDPWRPVERAVITHGHSDHARRGHAHLLAHTASAPILRQRLGADFRLQTLDYGQPIVHGGVRLSLHPAGHVLGSAQIRLEHRGRVCVVSGDYKTEPDGTCTPFEPVPCHTFITESTFGLPIYRWLPQSQLMAHILQWWQANAAEGRASVILCYAFGKAQRLLHGLHVALGGGPAPGPVITHGAIDPLNAAYLAAGVPLLPTQRLSLRAPSRRGAKTSAAHPEATAVGQALVLAPPSVLGSPWLRRFGAEARIAMASGWMQVRGQRRRRGVDQGFVLSDHADWPGLLQAIAATGAEHIRVTHGSVAPLVRWLSEQGLDAQALHTEYGAEDEASDPATDPASEPPSEPSSAPPCPHPAGT